MKKPEKVPYMQQGATQDYKASIGYNYGRNQAIDEYKRYHEWVIKDINATERGKTKKFICELYKLLQCGSFGRVIEKIKRLQKQKGQV